MSNVQSFKPEYLKCRRCNRIIKSEHADERGFCCFCHEPEPTKPKRRPFDEAA